MALILFNLISVASCPGTYRWRVAQVEIMCNTSPSPRRARRAVLPQVATTSGAVMSVMSARSPSTRAVKAAQKRALLAAPEPDRDKILGPGEGGAQHHKHDLGQGIEHLARLPWVFQSRKVVEKRRCAHGIGRQMDTRNESEIPSPVNPPRIQAIALGPSPSAFQPHAVSGTTRLAASATGIRSCRVPVFRFWLC